MRKVVASYLLVLLTVCTTCLCENGILQSESKPNVMLSNLVLSWCICIQAHHLLSKISTRWKADAWLNTAVQQ